MTRRFTTIDSAWFKYLVGKYLIDGVELSYDFYSQKVTLWVHLANRFPRYQWLQCFECFLSSDLIAPILESYISLLDFESEDDNQKITKSSLIISGTTIDGVYNFSNSERQFCELSKAEELFSQIAEVIETKLIVDCNDWPKENKERLVNCLEQKCKMFETMNNIFVFDDLPDVHQINDNADLATYLVMTYIVARSVCIIFDGSKKMTQPRKPIIISKELELASKRVKILEDEYESSKLFYEAKDL